MAKKQKSHLQAAVDRVSNMKASIEDTQAEVDAAEEKYAQAYMAAQEALRDLNDAKSLLMAKNQKYEREKASVMQILNADKGACEGKSVYESLTTPAESFIIRNRD
jgi:hypothetical protein